MAKISDLPLNELYERKITGSVETAIQSKEDFTKFSADYCKNVCKLKCKDNSKSVLLDEELDIMIIQDHAAPRGKYDKREGIQERVQRDIIEFICQKAGFQGLKYRLVNLLKCPTNSMDFPQGKPPTATVISKCKPYLLGEIQRCRPKAIISLSTVVTKALGLTKHSNTGNRGEIANGNVIITLHPRVLSMIRQNASGAMWGNGYLEIIRRDFEKAARIARGELKVKALVDGIEEQKKNITICKNLDEIRQVVELISALPEGSLVSCDTETNALDGLQEGAKLLCIQFGWKDPSTNVHKAAVIPLWHRENDRYNPSIAWRLVTPLLVSENILKVFHHGKFDILFIYHTTGVRVKGFEFDTMLLLHALDSGIQGCLSLKAAIWDHALDLGLGGYENLLPKLTKKKNEEELEEGEEIGD